MRHALVGLASLALAGCSTVTTSAGNFISAQHEPFWFDDAVKKANEYCAPKGMQAKHLATEGPALGRPISRFECVPK